MVRTSAREEVHLVARILPAEVDLAVPRDHQPAAPVVLRLVVKREPNHGTARRRLVGVDPPAHVPPCTWTRWTAPS
ncbi:MAG TPA: hypothetical protein VE173_01225, partial [Longimicrobiales bacterium]|nr:hypothetical protein [Longimicrobiales bacterium]